MTTLLLFAIDIYQYVDDPDHVRSDECSTWTSFYACTLPPRSTHVYYKSFGIASPIFCLGLRLFSDRHSICLQVGMTQIVRDHAQIVAPKIYGYYDNTPNPINAEVVLLELVRTSFPSSTV
jgi:hypothetical protein